MITRHFTFFPILCYMRKNLIRRGKIEKNANLQAKRWKDDFLHLSMDIDGLAKFWWDDWILVENDRNPLETLKNII